MNSIPNALEKFLHPIVESLKAEKLDTVIQLTDEALKARPKDSTLFYSRGYARMLVGGHDSSAEKDLQRSVALFSENPYAQTALAEILVRLNRYQESLKHAKLAVSKQPQNPLFLRQLGVSELKNGHNIESIKIFQKLLELVPDDPQSLFWFGMAHISANHESEAEDTLERFVETLSSIDAKKAKPVIDIALQEIEWLKKQNQKNHKYLEKLKNRLNQLS
jgi:predicted Zn-dependent protease